MRFAPPPELILTDPTRYYATHSFHSGRFLYEPNYQAGLRILDISDPENPVGVGRFDTTPYGDEAPGFGGTWSNYPFFQGGIIATGSRGEGLFLVRKREVGLQLVRHSFPM